MEQQTGSVQRLTGPGESAIAVYRFQGYEALALAATRLQLRGQASLLERSVGKVHYGFWTHGSDEGHVEDVVMCRVAEQAIEVHFHGSLAVENSLRSWAEGHELDWLETPLSERFADAPDSGLLPETDDDPRAWSALNELAPISVEDAGETQVQELSKLRSFIRTQMAEALVKTVAPEPATVLMKQAAGQLENAIQAIGQQLNEPASALKQVQTLRKTWSFGRRFTVPTIVLLTGKPNVGKSSLINAMLGYSRSIVTEIAGTTRDLVTEETLIDGWPFRLVDSAGVRADGDELEMIGIGKVNEAKLKADIIVQVGDANDGDLEFESEGNAGSIVVLNKCDLMNSKPLPQDDSHIHASAKTGQGVLELMKLISKKAAAKMQRPDDWKQNPVVVSQAIDDWLAQLEQALKS